MVANFFAYAHLGVMVVLFLISTSLLNENWKCLIKYVLGFPIFHDLYLSLPFFFYFFFFSLGL